MSFNQNLKFAFTFLLAFFNCSFGMAQIPNIKKVSANPKNAIINWNIVVPVKELNIQLDDLFQNKINRLSEEELFLGTSFYGKGKVHIHDKNQSTSMSLQYSMRLYDIPLEQFLSIIPSHDWGLYLDKLIARGIEQRTTDKLGKVNSQIERMILKSFPMNMDMVKAEIIEYEKDRVTVYWRVFDSVNNSTLEDIGSVEFKSENNRTLITFRSGHVIGSNPLFKTPLPNFKWLQKTIAETFKGHLENYKKYLP